MKFGISKHNDKIVCGYCGSYLLRGEFYVLITFPKRSGGWFRLFFHADDNNCYLEWVKKNYEGKMENWQGGKLPKLGRPRKYKDGGTAHRIKALIHYHKGKGNEDRVKELESELKPLIK